MFILTQYDENLDTKIVIGGHEQMDICHDAAFSLADNMVEKSSINGITTMTIKYVEIGAGSENVYCKDSEDRIMMTWTIREIPTLDEV